VRFPCSGPSVIRADPKRIDQWQCKPETKRLLAEIGEAGVRSGRFLCQVVSAVTGVESIAMTRALGTSLSAALVERLSQRDIERRLGIALPFVTLDAGGHPHPMVLSYLELRAYDTGTIGLVIQARSSSARNLTERRVGTLLLIEPDTTVYVKTRAVDGPLDIPGDELFGLGYFLLGVEHVIEDAATAWETNMRITTPIQYAPTPTLEEPWAKLTLKALAHPRARA
jgi:hypothetical protein